MAKKNTKSNSKTKVKPTKESGVGHFLASPSFAVVRGSFYVLLAVYCFLAVTNYVVELLRNGMDVDLSLKWCGPVGGKIAQLLVQNTFGIMSYGLIFLLAVYGLRLVSKNRREKSDKAPKATIWHDDRRFKKCLWATLFWVYWGAATFGWLSLLFDASSVLESLAGVVGAWTANLLNSLLKIGFPILHFFVAAAFLYVVHHVAIPLPKTKEKESKDYAAKPQTAEKSNFFSRMLKRKKDEDKKEKENDGFAKLAGTFNNTQDQPETAHQASDWQNTNVSDKQTKDDDNPDEGDGTVTFDIDAEFERVNKNARNASTTDSDEPVFIVKQTDDQQEEVESATDEEEMEPDDYRIHYGVGDPYDPKLDLKDFVMPSTDILEDWEKKNVKVTNAELVANKDRIVETLRNYGIEIVGITASPGPTVTLYEIRPAPGIRISKIKSLEDDIALSLSALGIRIIAPIPGRGSIGIEVPNANPQVVSMKTMLTSEAFVESKAELPIAFGKTISNDVFVTDLAKMPHLLMAGATGTGKSVGLNVVIASLLYKKHPAELKFVMVDPKKVELSLYNIIERHYLAKLPDAEEAIITDVKKVVRTLNSLCIEMDQRYDLLKAAKVRNIQEYNPKFINRQLNPEKGHRYLPYIVLVIDEFADLIMTAGKEVELPICRLAQLARAVGIHLIIATQRPTTNIITGAIKANFPARIAFRVISAIDSRTILDAGGANQLIGRGDMLISLAGKDLVRCQCALIETVEIDRLAHSIGEQRGYADGEGFLLPEYLDETDEPNKDFDPKQKDEYFNDAARLVVSSQFGSTSLLQRKLQLGYNRAGRIIDQLEAAGIVGPYNGSKAREVLVKDEVTLNEILRSL